MKKKQIIGIIAVAIVAGALGWLIKPNHEAHNHTETVTESQIWTCSMHPQIRSNEPGNCPICGMDLIPLEEEGESANSHEISLTENARRLANVQTEVVGHSETSNEIRLSGKVKPDERLVQSQTAHFPGRIESLAVDFTGAYVEKGQVIARIYSPQLLVAQRELQEAARFKDSQPSLYQGARRKLQNWTIPAHQIDAIEAGSIDMNAFPVLANASGYVTALNVSQGDYIDRGTVMYEITGLEKVWISLDVYENQLNAISKGDEVTYTVRSNPGNKYTGVIDYLDPVLQGSRRTLEARVVHQNRGQELKPEMIVSAVVKPKVNSMQLSVPSSAVLWTGERSIVYVENPSSAGVYQLRNVELGQQIGRRYEVLKGLQSGEKVVINGTFTVDAAAQLASKPSMMSNESESKHAVSAQTEEKLRQLLSTYLEWENALHNDELEKARSAFNAFQDNASQFQMSDFAGPAHQVYMEAVSGLELSGSSASISIQELREQFYSASKALILLTEKIEYNTDELYVLHCPMANSNNGADWLSTQPEVLNPYFGSSMLRCGEVKSAI
ncbi:efflux RND transporter periplasmic adaptor subunit [Phaeocystidibacter luteus]|uniref:Efflux RND transporter periplasmic adaptor subunit n=1 Tax=Phaeocystidibacter luteus TaxID=911197 RepID=A0A6N6RDS8_9FLAO|nr:efflux RND transporter periplasmic adaptor subunit [Phaeocystidibacter luteus]KAB2807688.1 efflux RND transporter periplasmic adaptor subunit [Phaeocystidibacter luteus]